MRKLREIYEGILLLAFVFVAMYGLGNVDDLGQVFLSTSAMVILAKLMSMAGMMSRAVEKPKKKYNDEKANY